ncbi:MAG: GIY-YIG nuclease family protein [Deltaproteobacteria bacterium]|nr:GIY-YIG nuclease family protein [Deltaproteobacteria bacterium]
MDRGSYVLVIRLKRRRKIQVGHLGQADFPAGYYVYTGSARGGLANRIARHLRKRGKKLRWHIDYLIRCPEAAVVEVLALPSRRREECRVNRLVGALPGARVILRGFGSSDCREGCPSHLAYFSGPSPVRAFRKMAGLARQRLQSALRGQQGEVLHPRPPTRPFPVRGSPRTPPGPPPRSSPGG